MGGGAIKKVMVLDDAVLTAGLNPTDTNQSGRKDEMDLLSEFRSVVAVRGSVDTANSFLEDFHGRFYSVTSVRGSWSLDSIDGLLGVRQPFESRFLLVQLGSWVMVASNGKLATEATLPRVYSRRGLGLGLSCILKPKMRSFSLMDGEKIRTIAYDCEESKRWVYQASGEPLPIESEAAQLDPSAGLSESWLRGLLGKVGFELNHDFTEPRPGFLRTRERRP